MAEVRQRIAREIGDRGAVTFARYMELALYCPNSGYYEREEDIVGSRGDYYTSVSVGSLLGELLALQFTDWLQDCLVPEAKGQPPGAGREPDNNGQPLRIVEAGAHSGDLAKDILGWLRQHRSSLLKNLEYWIVEPSDRRRLQQQHNLREFGSNVRWAKKMAELLSRPISESYSASSGSVRGIIFSNELLDAMPVHRLGWDAKARTWFEWGVTLQSGQFVWTRIFSGRSGHTGRLSRDSISVSFPQLPTEDRLLDRLPDGFTIEICPAAEEWWRTAATALERGKLVAIDYGLLAEEFLVPERKDGTMRGYHRHQPSGNVLAHPGEEDITAHVNFTAIRNAGEATGLITEVLWTQARFLTCIAERIWKAEASFGEWTPERTRQFQTLTHPEYFGRSFHVLVQSRGGWAPKPG
jgi:SAM-dependent MidA family methyltransferase